MNLIRVIKRLLGGLSLDVNLNDVPKHDFIDGVDVVDRDPATGAKLGYLQPENNTAFAYNIGETTLENSKTYRVIIDISDLTTCTVNFNISLPSAYSVDVPCAFTTGDSTAVLYTSIQTGFSAFAPLSTAIFSSSVTGATILEFTLEIPYYLYTDWFLSVSDTVGLGVYNVYVIRDAVSSEKIGTFEPIEFINEKTAQQIFATINMAEPESVVCATTSTAQELYITAPSNNYFLDNEEVFIYGDIENAYITLEQVTSISYRCIGSMNPVTGILAFPVKDYTVVRYKRSLSIIGYATKNYLTGDWAYTELLRSINLNFRLYKQIQANGQLTDNGVIYNWTDFLNQIKRLYYFGDIVTGGFLTYYNSDAIYDLDTIDVESRLQFGVNTSKVKLSVSNPISATGKSGYSAGTKPEATYCAFVRFKTRDGAYSTFSRPSNIVWLHSINLFEHLHGINSGRALQIDISQIEEGIFDYYQIGIIQFSSSAYSGYLLPEQLINGSTDISIVDDGSQSASYISFDATSLLEQIPFVFENARSILPYNNYVIASNVNLYQEYDLTEWAQTIQVEQDIRDIDVELDYSVGSPASFLLGINEQSKCSSEWMSFMPNDTYRVCVFIDWKSGAPTSCYWVGDYNFVDTNIDITDTTASPTAIYQHFLVFRNIDTAYVLPDGKVLSEVIKDIRFGRTLCNSQVVASGIGVLARTTGGTPAYTTNNAYFTVSPGTPDPNIVLDRLIFYSPDLQNTGNGILFETGDEVIAYPVTQQQFYTDTNIVAVDYFGNGAPSAVTSVVGSLNNQNIRDTTGILSMVKTYAGNIVYLRGGVAMTLNTALTGSNYGVQQVYYIKPYPSGIAYPEPPESSRYFFLPQDSWYDSSTHTASTRYEVYGGDCFPQKSYYKIAEDVSGAGTSKYSNLIGFYSYNRYNDSMRSGNFPYYSILDYLTNDFLTDTSLGIGKVSDIYTYDQSFTPKYLFQTQVSFNSALRQITYLGASIFYSGVGYGYTLAGGNKTWLPLDRKDLDPTFGSITHMDVLLGFSQNGMLVVWQQKRTTAQYFDNTANLVSNSGELLIGNGTIMGRTGVDFTEYGCEHKWAIKKGQNLAGHDIVYWPCFRKGTIMRLGADGTSNIVGNISTLLVNYTFLAYQDEYNNTDTPAKDYGCHAVWNNQTKEYILTLRLFPKPANSRTTWNEGEWRVGSTTWGFEKFPVMYRSNINGNVSTPPNSTWDTFNDYDDSVFQLVTIVWNENDNVFKTHRTFLPKIYGEFNNTYVSVSPRTLNDIFEHNQPDSEALFYCKLVETAVTATTSPSTYRINGTNIQSTFPLGYTPLPRAKYIVIIDGRTFQVIGIGTNYLEMANVDDDDILPQVTINNFSYYICNSQDPYITGVVNETGGRYLHYVGKNVQCEDTLKRTEYESGFMTNTETESFTNKEEEEIYNGDSNVQIKMDTTDNPDDNTISSNYVEGKWLKIKNIFRWGKANRVYTIAVNALETQKTK